MCTDYPSVYVILQPLYLDVVPQSLDNFNPAVFFETQDIPSTKRVSTCKNLQPTAYLVRVGPCIVLENER